MIKVGDKVLVTTDAWFFAPDGEEYRAVFGTLHGVYTSEDTLGVKTNARSTNWYVVIGNMTLAGCQIHYVIKTQWVSFEPPMRELEKDGSLCLSKANTSRIYNADGAPQ